MEKGFLFLDIPETCDTCPVENSDNWECPVLHKKTGDENNEPRYSGRLPGCPIKEVPKRRDTGELSEKIYESKTATPAEREKFAYRLGWNHCLYTMTERR